MLFYVEVDDSNSSVLGVQREGAENPVVSS